MLFLLYRVWSTAFFALLLSVLIPDATAQDIPGPDTKPDWGEIPESQLLMKNFYADTSAAAVILSDFAEVSFRNDRYVVLDRHTRIKILSEAGFDWGTVSLTYWAEDRAQRVRAVKGQTFTVDENGEVERHKMDGDAIFTEEIDGSRERIRFTLPALEPGAVIEFSYQLISDGPQWMPDWQFQRSEPVLWSEYVAEIPSIYSYARKIVGTHPFVVESAEEIRNGNLKLLRWAMEDIPALREEVYMTTPDDYRAAIEFQLSGYMSSVGWTNYMVSWNEVADQLMSHPNFGVQLEGSRAIRSQVEALIAGNTTPREKLERIYSFVTTSIEWDNSDGIVADDDISHILETKSGGRAGINLLLVSMLREAGLQADPVLISTRSHGQTVEEYPLLSQFNSSLVAVQLSRERVLMDATDPMRPWTLLPQDALNRRGWLVSESGASWIPIVSEERYDHSVDIDATLDENGTLTASFQSTSGGYAATGMRHALSDAESTEEFVKETLLEEIADLSIASTNVANMDSVANQLQVEADFTVPGFAQQTGDFLFFTPVLAERFDENPLKLPERTFPVDMSFPYTISYTFRMEVPHGWTAEKEELPPLLLSRLPLDGGLFRREVQVINDVLTVKTVFVINRTLFRSRLYQDLRSFFEDVVAAQNEQIVFARATESDSDSDEEATGDTN